MDRYPLHPRNLNVNAPASELMIGQTPYDEIVNWIDTELKDVSTKLPAVYPEQQQLGKSYFGDGTGNQGPDTAFCSKSPF